MHQLRVYKILRADVRKQKIKKDGIVVNQDKTRICIMLGALYEGGIGRVASIMMNSLSKRENLEIHAMLYAPPKGPEIYELSSDVIKSYLLDEHVNMQTALLKKHAIKKLKKYLHENQIDIVIACGDLFYIVALVAGKLSGTKVICWDHTNMFSNTDQKFQRITRETGATFCDYNLVLTKAALEYYEKYHKLKKNYQIYNPVDQKAMVDCDYAEDSKKIISVGRLSYQKNFSRLLDIASVVFKKHPDWTWHIYGSGDNLKELEEKKNSLNLQNNVFFEGQVSNIYELYREYAFIVMTSRYEGFPMTLLEGAGSGLPMVSFDVQTGPNEIIVDGENGFLCDKDSDAEMVTRINGLIENPELRKKLSVGSKKTAEKFNLQTITDQWIELIERVVAR